jgi:hypothetical protein
MTEIILAIVALIIFTAFALKPAETMIFTNALVILIIMVQLYTVNVITDLYEKLDKIKVVKKR